MTKTLSKENSSSMKITCRVPSILCSTFARAWLGLAIGSGVDLCCLQVMYYVNQVHDTELQEDHIFLASVSP